MTRSKIKILSVLVMLYMYAGVVFAEQNPSQQELVAVLRQLEQIQSTVAYQANLPIEPHARYYFDYQRLQADIERIKTGINDYLTPKRAQPRDPVEIHGNYQQESKP